MKPKPRHFKILLWQEGDQYVSQCLNVDVASCGNTKAEAKANLIEALTLYFEDGLQDEYVKVEKAELLDYTSEHA